MSPAEPFPVEPAIVGIRWAGLLCAALLTGLALFTAARGLGNPSSQEKIVLQPVTPADFVRESPDLSAPDPGDSP